VRLIDKERQIAGTAYKYKGTVRGARPVAIRMNALPESEAYPKNWKNGRKNVPRKRYVLIRCSWQMPSRRNIVKMPLEPTRRISHFGHEESEKPKRHVSESFIGLLSQIRRQEKF
jgi:hypothetical protein